LSRLALAVVGGTFKFTKYTWMVKSYEIPGYVGDLVAYQGISIL
jgi:hypothetical protein